MTASSNASTELRVVTVLFADLVGFSTAAERSDAEATRALLEEYFALCRTVIDRYAGTIEKFAGDAVMAVWGYPQAGEDAAERAVRAAIDLVQAIESSPIGHALRVGITTGTVAVATEATADGLVAGDVVNLAARLQQIAAPDEVWTDQATRDAAHDSIDFDPRGEFTVKGRSQPVSAFAARAVMGERGGRGRLDVLTVPLVGYRRELGAIKDALHATIEGDRGRLVVVSGSAGTGKSRLGRELLNYADGVESGIRWHSSRASALDAATPYAALEAAVRGRLGVTDHNPEELAARLDAHVREFVPDLARRGQIRAALAALLGVGGHDLSRQDLTLGWIAWFSALASEGEDTVVWVLDDAHFADSLLLDFVELLVTTIGERMLVVLLARPELLAAHPGLVAVRGSTVIGLEGLTRQGMTELVQELIDDVPDDVRDDLVAGAGGLPLYAIEVVRGMIDRGEIEIVDGRRVLTGVTGVPTVTPTLSGVVMSRLELLELSDRRLLQQASVLGLSFTVGQLAALVEDSTERTQAQLERLSAKDLVRTANDTLSSEYGHVSFVQALVQQVAYDSLSRQERARLHLRAAEVLSGVETDSGLVVEHLLIARELDDSAPTDLDVTEWLTAAAARAERTSAYAIAVRHYELAIETTTDEARLNTLHLRAADGAALRGDFALARFHAGCVDSDIVDEQLLASIITVRCDLWQGRMAEALATLDVWGEELPPGVSHAMAARWAAANSKVRSEGSADISAVWAERSLVFAEATGNPALIHDAVNLLANASAGRGLGRVASALHAEAARVARENGLSYQLTISLNNTALREALRGDLPRAVDTLQEAIELGLQSGTAISMLYPIAARIEYLVLLGRLDEALAQVELGESLFGRTTVENALENSELVQAMVWAREIAGHEVPTSLYELYQTAIGTDSDLIRTGSSALLSIASATGRDDRAVIARTSVRNEFDAAGIGDAFTTLWPRGADTNLEAEDFAGVREMCTYLPELSVGSEYRVLAVQAGRVRATLEALDPASVVPRAEVEVALRTSLEELEALGLELDRARTLLALARMLDGVGRTSGANAARDEATVALGAMGAHGLLRRHGLEVAATTA